MKKIVIIGAGYAGVLTAKRLEKKLKKSNDVEITLINKNTYHTMLTELHEVAAGRVEEDSIRMELDDIFAHRKVNLVIDEVTGIDFNNKSITLKDGEMDYDYLVIGTGCRPTFYDVQGSENIFTLWSYEDAVSLNYQIHEMFRKAQYESDYETRKKLLSFVVVGSGFTGVEMAGELAEYKKHLCYQYDIAEVEVSIRMVEAGDKILPFYSEKLRAKVMKRLEKMDVEVLLNRAVCDVSERNCKFDETSIVDTYTVIWAAGIQGSKLISNMNDVEATHNGRIKTNEYLQALGHDNVFVIGDNIFYTPKGMDSPVPQMVENAEHSSHTVAHNINAILKGKELEEYTPKFSGSMVCVGGRWGVASVGRGKQREFTGFIAMFIKHLINVVYFIQVLGLHKVWSYAKHEFFVVKNNRSILGGHFSNAKSAPGFFLFPLRILVGFLWFASGFSKLPKVMEDWRNVFLLPPNPLDAKSAATGEVADATTAATGEAVEAVSSATGEVVEAASEVLPELSGFEELAKTLGDYTELSAGKALPVPEFLQDIMNKSYELFFWSETGGFTAMAGAVQASMIILEIIIGIMFILGLFTPVAAVLSVIVMIIIYLSGWSYISIIIFGFASLGCFFAGNVLGLDYYLLPKIDKFLRKFKLTRKWYLYFKHE